MKIQHLVGQHLVIGLAGHSISSDEKSFIVKNNIAGVNLFGRNVSSPEQVQSLCAEIQALRTQVPSKKPLFIAIDMEGGRVARLKAPFTQWPAMQNLGAFNSVEMGYQFASSMSVELKACGINLNYSPVLDTFTNPKNAIIGDRAFSSDPEIVAKVSQGVIAGFAGSGIIPCGKHFPGHGNTLLDSHLDLPVEDKDLLALEKTELIPFRHAVKSGLQMIMTSHIKFPAIDSDWCVTLSEIFLKRLLREDMRFQGVVVSDDMGMKGLTKEMDRTEVPVRALRAGVDLLCYCNEPDAPPMAIEEICRAISNNQLRRDDLENSYERILGLKKQFLKEGNLKPNKDSLSKIGLPAHQQLAEKIRLGPEV
jgi:beta-N-acetylhexosaminidase